MLTPNDLKQSLILNTFDKYYAAVLFDLNRPMAERLYKMGVIVGGTGWSIDSKLPPEVEAMKPDYDLYGIDYGMGFTSRGCIRKYQFCVVPQKEGCIREVCMPGDLENKKSKKLILLDNNFLASPLWREKCQDIISNKYRVDFCQGLDIRLINLENAAYLAMVKHEKQIRFAFDNLSLESLVRRGIETLMGGSNKTVSLNVLYTG